MNSGTFIFVREGHLLIKRVENTATIFRFYLTTISGGNKIDTERKVGEYLTLYNPIFLPTSYFPALIYIARERSWCITCNYPTVLKEKNRNRKNTTCAICWLKFVVHEETGKS
jgi:hypothetical protein